MKNFDPEVLNFDEDKFKSLYSFMATNYDITDLAGKIYATKCLKINTLNLKKGSVV